MGETNCASGSVWAVAAIAIRTYRRETNLSDERGH